MRTFYASLIFPRRRISALSDNSVPLPRPDRPRYAQPLPVTICSIVSTRICSVSRAAPLSLAHSVCHSFTQSAIGAVCHYNDVCLLGLYILLWHQHQQRKQPPQQRLLLWFTYCRTIQPPNHLAPPRSLSHPLSPSRSLCGSAYLAGCKFKCCTNMKSNLHNILPSVKWLSMLSARCRACVAAPPMRRLLVATAGQANHRATRLRRWLWGVGKLESLAIVHI